MDYRSVLNEGPENSYPEDSKISFNYTCLEDMWKRNEIIIDDVFSSVMAIKIVKSDEIEPRSVVEAHC